MHQAFEKGHFSVQRQEKRGFSGVACDMTIEQTANRDSKTRGGMKGFTSNKGASSRWIKAHHERASITRQCEEMAGREKKGAIRKDLTPSRKIKDKSDVQNIISTVLNMKNPFENDPETDPGDLVHLSSGVVAPQDVCSDLLTAHKKGDDAFIAFSKERLLGEIDLNETLKKFQLKTFTHASKRKRVVLKGKSVKVQSDRELLGRLVVIGKVHDIDHRKILSYCSGQFPLSLAKNEGCLVKTNKAKLLHALEDGPDTSLCVEIPSRSVWIIDGMAMLQQMSPKNMPHTMGQLADKVLKQLVCLACSNESTVIHFVTDRYPEVSIKNAERQHRAASGSQKIHISKPDQLIPKQWKKYLAHGYNKENLVNFFFETWKKADVAALKDVTVFLTHGEQCHSITPLRRLPN